MSEKVLYPMIYADVDLNFIDGSAVWLTSIIETLSQNDNIQPTILLKSPIERSLLLEDIISKGKVTIIDPWSEEYYTDLTVPFLKKNKNRVKRLRPEEAVEIIDFLDQKNKYDFFIVRGYELSQIISQNYTFSLRTWFYLTDYPQKEEEVTEIDLFNLQILYKNSSCIACQTYDLIDYFQKLLHSDNNEKFVYLPPMIPNVQSEPVIKNNSNQLIYAGKFAPFWKVPEMFKAFNELEISNSTFLVIGDKFHNYPYVAGYKEEVENILNSSKNIIWKKALSRSEVQKEIQKSDIGISWRDKDLDDSKELSTKVLEYGLYGKPVIMNRNKLHEKIFGTEYPLYANTKDEVKQVILETINNPDVYELAAKKMYQVSLQHTFSKISEYLIPIISQKTQNTKQFLNVDSRKFKKVNIVFAGHDLKFAKILIDHFTYSEYYNVKVDQWNGHNSHDLFKSKELIKWADVIIAEWGLGNAVWYSNNKTRSQKMIIRMHLQEKETDYPKNIKWSAVDKLIFIAPTLKDQMLQAFNFIPKEKIEIIHNLVDVKKINKSKLPDYQFNIGIQGIAPQRKRLDLALNIFEELWNKDKRYTLYVKGKLPNEYNWLWNRTEEKAYYEKIFRKINSSEYRDAVVFEGWGDISQWYQKLGFVLSVSDFESFHLAVAEGMAAGTIPIIRNWEGSVELYPKKFIYNDIFEAIELIESYNGAKRLDDMTYVKKFVNERYDKTVITGQWETLISSLIID